MSTLRTAFKDAAQWFRGRHKAVLDALDAIIAREEVGGYYLAYQGTITWSGGGATLNTTISGLLTTDKVHVNVRVKPTQAAYLVRAIPSAANTLTVELSAANTSNDCQFSYWVWRAV